MSSGLGQTRCISEDYKAILAESQFGDLNEDDFRSKVVFKPDDRFMQRDDHTTYKLSKACMNAWTRLLVEKLKKVRSTECFRQINCL